MGRVAAGSPQLGREITDQPRAATAAIRKSGGLSISRESLVAVARIVADLGCCAANSLSNVAIAAIIAGKDPAFTLTPKMC